MEVAGKFDYAVASHIVEDVMNPESLGGKTSLLDGPSPAVEPWISWRALSLAPQDLPLRMLEPLGRNIWDTWEASVCHRPTIDYHHHFSRFLL